MASPRLANDHASHKSCIGKKGFADCAEVQGRDLSHTPGKFLLGEEAKSLGQDRDALHSCYSFAMSIAGAVRSANCFVRISAT